MLIEVLDLKIASQVCVLNLDDGQPVIQSLQVILLCLCHTTGWRYVVFIIILYFNDFYNWMMVAAIYLLYTYNDSYGP